MAGSYYVGKVAGHGEDVLPSTGPHLDWRITDAQGKPVHPDSARSFLGSRLLVGKNKTPLYQQKGKDWQASFPITSGYDARNAPTKGASNFHPAYDFGIGAGEPLTWLPKPGDVYTPGKGYGSISTTNNQGKAYTVKLLHTTPGAAVGTAGAQPQQPQQTAATGGDIYNYYIMGGAKPTVNTGDFLQEYVSSLFNKRKKFDAVESVLGAMSGAGDITYA